MNIIEIASAALFIFSGSLFAYLGWRSFKIWREIREEVIFHFMMTFFAVSLICVDFMIYFTFISPIPFILVVNALFIVGIVYDLFYLEISFIFLSLFPNTRKMIDKYIPLVIASAILMNIIASSAQDEFYNLVGTALHVIVVCIGLSLLIRIIYKFRSNEKYFRKTEEKVFVNHLVKIALFTLVFFVIDGVGFLVWYYLAGVNFVITDIILVFIGVAITLSAVLAFYITISAGRKSKGCDLLSLLNTIS